MNTEVDKFDSEGLQCPSCDSLRIRTELRDQEFLYGVGDKAVELRATVPVHICNDCDQAFSGEIAAQLRHAAVCEHESVLAPNQIVAIRAQYSLSRREFAARTRIGLATLARWEQGEIIQNGAMDNYMRLLSHRENLELLASALVSNAKPVAQKHEPVSLDRFRSLKNIGGEKQSALVRNARTFNPSKPTVKVA